MTVWKGVLPFLALCSSTMPGLAQEKKVAIPEKKVAVPEKKIAIPSGTGIDVILADPIDSDKASAGEVSRATVHRAIVVGDNVAVRKGSEATLQLQPAGKDWYIKLTQLNVRGKRYPVTAGFAEVKSSVSGKKVGKRAVGLGAMGGIIGGVAGGGKGAAIGAGTGAGLGAATGAASRGGKLYLPSETVLSFQLRADLTVDLAK